MNVEFEKHYKYRRDSIRAVLFYYRRLAEQHGFDLTLSPPGVGVLFAFSIRRLKKIYFRGSTGYGYDKRQFDRYTHKVKKQTDDLLATLTNYHNRAVFSFLVETKDSINIKGFIDQLTLVSRLADEQLVKGPPQPSNTLRKEITGLYFSMKAASGKEGKYTKNAYSGEITGDFSQFLKDCYLSTGIIEKTDKSIATDIDRISKDAGCSEENFQHWLSEQRSLQHQPDWFQEEELASAWSDIPKCMILSVGVGLPVFCQ